MVNYSADLRPATVPDDVDLTPRALNLNIGTQLAVAESVMVFAAALGCQALYTTAVWGSPGNLAVASGVGLVLAANYVLIAHARQLYSTSRILTEPAAVADVASAWLLACLIAAMSAFLLGVGNHVSRVSALLTLATGFAALAALRLAAASAVRSGLALGMVRARRAVVLFVNEAGRERAVKLLGGQGYRIMRCLPLTGADPAAKPRFFEDLVDLVRAGEIDEVFLSAALPDLPNVEQLILQVGRLPVAVRFIAPEQMQPLLHKPLRDFGRFKAFELTRPALRRHERAIKRGLDILGASIALLVLWPAFLIVALLIKLDSRGPVFFMQDRAGYNGRTFRIFKFRSMHALDNGDIIRQATRGDPRVTRVGRWLRATSLDELPQFLNVLIGDMSLVGPRPHALAHDSEYGALISDYGLRHHAKPGITGLAQVVGLRGETAAPELMQRRVESDLWYITNWSLWLDIRILFRTLGVVVNVSKVY
ncbi:MAG TPA: exopolysaccharide biosynthesis polyprenyl glycosylphosphotransferase [Bosea sp. (in: a-proteobacteria)]